MWEAPPLRALEDAVRDPASPIGMRMRAAYFLRQAYDNAVRNAEGGGDGGEEKKVQHANATDDDDVSAVVIRTLGLGLADRRHGSLLRHEFAYVMGQLRDSRSCSYLEATLSDPTDDSMVRHECAEALGAIGAPESIPALERVFEAEPASIEVGETCKLAVAYMRWKLNGDGSDQPAACACMLSPYSSVDPAPPHPKHASVATSDLGSILRDATLPLFERYRAMFSLRNRGGTEAVAELGQTLVSDESSALLRHEVAYVLGQMQHPDSVEYLAESLRREGEHKMVRHESAEALGAIEGRWDDCERILNEFINDMDDVVRESCLVALDAADYWGHAAQVSDDSEDEPCSGSGKKIKDRLEDEDGADETAPSFVQQKAITNGRNDSAEHSRNNLTSTTSPAKETLLNHFNVTR